MEDRVKGKDNYLQSGGGGVRLKEEQGEGEGEDEIAQLIDRLK